MELQDQDVRIARLAEADPILREMVFTRCRILGPAVLASLGATQWRGNSFDSPHLLIEVPEDKVIIGVIGVEDCLFESCTFENIGVIGNPSLIARFKGDLGLD